MVRAVSSLLAAIGLALVQGCLKLPEAGPLPVPPAAPREGYVVLGPLLPLHPLWPEARRLHEKALALQRSVVARAGAPVEMLLETPLVEPLTLPEPFGPGPLALTPAPAQPFDNPALRRHLEGLEQVLRWQRDRIEAKYARRMRQARAAEETALAKLEVELWQKAQVALNNLKIREAIGGIEGRQAREQREAIEAKIQRQVGAAREKAEQRLSALAEELARAKAQELAAVEAQLRSEAQPDVAAQLSTGAEDLAALQRALEMKWWQPPEAQATLPPELTKVAASLAERERRARTKQRAGLATVRGLQARRLRDQAEELQRLIREDVECAVRAIALSQGTVLHVLPLEPPAGRNMTREYAEMLRALWSQR